MFWKQTGLYRSRDLHSICRLISFFSYCEGSQHVLRDTTISLKTQPNGITFFNDFINTCFVYRDFYNSDPMLFSWTRVLLCR